MTRPSWNQFWMDLAVAYSSRGTCDRKKVGCVLVKNNIIVSAGYNGSLSGEDHCVDKGHIFIDGRNGCQRVAHAEANAVCLAARLGNSTKDCIAYATCLPCLDCFKILVQAGVEKIYYGEDYREKHSLIRAKDLDFPMIFLNTDKPQCTISEEEIAAILKKSAEGAQELHETLQTVFRLPKNDIKLR